MEPWGLSYDWDDTLGDDHIAHLRLVVDDATGSVIAAFDAWLATLEIISVRHLPGEVYRLGGATLTVAREAGGTPVSVSLRSGGQDTSDSLEYAAEALAEALQGAEVHWVEMPYEPAFAPHGDEVSGQGPGSFPHQVSLMRSPDYESADRPLPQGSESFVVPLLPGGAAIR